MSLEELGNKDRLSLVPLEVLDSVADHLDLSSLTNLQSCSRHYRNALVRKSWCHFHLDVIDIGDPPEYENALLSNAGKEDVCDERSFLAQRLGLLSRMKVDQSNLSSFAKAIVDGSLASLLPLVKVFTLESQYFHPKAGKLPMDQKAADASNFDIANWLFTRTLPGLLTGLKLVELFVEVDQADSVPIVTKFLSRLPNRELDIHLRVEGQWNKPDPILPANFLACVRIFKWVCRRFPHDGMDSVRRILGNKLSKSVKRFELVTNVPTTLDSRDLRDFLADSRVETLLLTPIDVDNRLGLDWLPTSVQDLALFDCKGEAPVVDASNVRYFVIDSLTGSVFQRYRFTNLERLFIGSYNGQHEIGLSSVSTLTQLRCEYMEPSLIKKLYQPSIKSIIVEHPGSELGAIEGTEETPNQLIDLFRGIYGLEFVLLDITCLDTRELLLTCLYTIVSQNPRVELFVEDMTKPRRATWLYPCDHGLVSDAHSTIRSSGKFLYRADTAIVLRYNYQA